MQLPEGGAQSHAYYVELCRAQGLLEVTAAELTGGAPAAAAGTGGEGGDGAGLQGLNPNPNPSPNPNPKPNQVRG